ncbi:hypothetical protein ACOMHN_013260 [Nucella lapillus]
MSRQRTCQQNGRVVNTANCRQGYAREDQPCDVRKEKMCPGCVVGCSGKADGLYPSCNSCALYIQCRFNQATVRRCPSNQEWDAAKLVCTHPPSETCSLAQPVTSCRGRVDGVYHVNGNCARYMECSNEIGVERSCRFTEEFNAHINKCDLPPSPTCERPFRDQRLLAQVARLPQDSPSANSNKTQEDSGKPDHENKERTSRNKAAGHPGTSKQTRKNKNLILKNKDFRNDQPAKDSDENDAFTPQPSGKKTTSEPNTSDTHTSKTGPPQNRSESDAKRSSKAETKEDPEIFQNRFADRKVVDEEKGDTPPKSDVKPEHDSASNVHDGVKSRHHGNRRRHHGHTRGKAFPCHANCEGLEKGKRYQSCQGCCFFLVCPQKGSPHIRRCHGYQKWDSAAERCKRHSSTCRHRGDNEVLDAEDGPSSEAVKRRSSSSKPAILGLKITAT